MQRYTHVCMIPSSLFMGLIHLTLLALTLLPPGLEGRSSAFPHGYACMHHAHDEERQSCCRPASSCMHLSTRPNQGKSKSCIHALLPLACLGHHCTAAPAATGHELCRNMESALACAGCLSG